MQLTPELKSFIRTHASDDTDRLLLTASRFPGIDIPFAVDQIMARRQIKEKLPTWFANEDLIYPSRLSTEQCSSEQTALYKQQLLKGESFCDLTGGLGVDSYYFAQKASRAIFVERFPEYCQAAMHNFASLKANHIQVMNSDARDIIDSVQADTFYIDPARRSDCNKRLFALTDCEPDILQLKPILLDKAQRVIVKISPMADVEETLRLLPETVEVHILAVKNECKELLFILEDPFADTRKTALKIHVANIVNSSHRQEFIFEPEEEKEAVADTTDTVGKFLYEPHAALLKSGAFKLAALRYNLKKLHRHSHLYTADELCTDFPGRIFEVDETMEFSGKLLKDLSKSIPKANLTTRNFPLSVADLRKRSKIKDGGEVYLFATTLANEKKVIVQAHKNGCL